MDENKSAAAVNDEVVLLFKPVAGVQLQRCQCRTCRFLIQAEKAVTEWNKFTRFPFEADKSSTHALRVCDFWPFASDSDGHYQF